MILKLDFYYDSTVEPFKRDDFNLQEVLRLLNELKSRGFLVEIHDVAGWDDGMRMEHYLKAVGPAVVKKYRIRRVFGSARNPGFLFGREVPALLVSEGEHVTDVYPHEQAGRRVTILEFLRKLAGRPERGTG
jgi:hypothetical protein